MACFHELLDNANGLDVKLRIVAPNVNLETGGGSHYTLHLMCRGLRDAGIEAVVRADDLGGCCKQPELFGNGNQSNKLPGFFIDQCPDPGSGMANTKCVYTKQ